MTTFTRLVDLASERFGGRAIAANDDFFAPKENLVKRSAAIFIPDKYTDRGKWMDGWETRRRRTPGHDWCIVQLGLAGVLRSIVVDTAFFRGNFPSHCSLEACSAPAATSVEELTSEHTVWTPVLGRSELEGDTQNTFEVGNAQRVTHVRLNIYPDGGVARLRVMGEVVPDWETIFEKQEEIDVASIVHGGYVADVSDRFFGEPHNMLMPDRAANMGDGWETKRRRGPGHDWAVVRLGVESTIRRVEVDTAHFKGNYPDRCSIEASADGCGWKVLLRETKLNPDRLHVYESELADVGPASELRLNIYPDGGISRFRALGVPTPAGRQRALLRVFNVMDVREARTALQDCCGAPRWVDRMLDRRPFESIEHLFAVSADTLGKLSAEEWLEALHHHPRIGEKAAERPQSMRAARWSAKEQSAAATASASDFAELASLNQEYERRFGFVFLVCATGRTLHEITAALRQRLTHDPETELRVAADEHRRITRIRLEKLLT